MAKKIEASQAKLKGWLAGGLFRYAFMMSIALHLGFWGVAILPKDIIGKKADIAIGDGKLDVKVVKKTYEDLPSPPSTEQLRPGRVPRDREAKPEVGKAPVLVSASPDRVEFVPYSNPPVLISENRPVYPDMARDSGLEGDVILLVYIDERGDVRNVIVQSSPGLPALEEAATKAAYKCKFKPAEQHGTPIGVWYSIVMEFRL